MKTLTKKDLVGQIMDCERDPELWMTRRSVMDVLEIALDLITCHFQNGGERVALKGFGAFKIRKRRAFTGSNPRTGEALVVPAKSSITFKPSGEMLSRIQREEHGSA